MTTTTETLQDTGFKLPPNIAASIQRANDLVAAQKAAQEGAAAEGEGAATVDDIPPFTADAPASAEVTQPVTEPKPGEPKPAETKPGEWEGRYKAMKGRYDKAQETVSALTADIAELRRQLEHAHATRPAPTAAPTTTTFTAEDITEEERAEYGPDLISVVERLAGRKIQNVIGSFEQKFADVENKIAGVTKVTALTAKERFDKTLTDRVPTWRQLNRDQNFLAWADGLDPYSGQTRLDLLRKAYDLGDAPRVAAIFEGFLQSEGNPAADPQKERKADPAPNDGKVSLESLAAPGRARSTAPDNGPGDKPIIARAQIDKFFADVRKGLYRGRDAEKERREAEIFEATAEGRVR